MYCMVHWVAKSWTRLSDFHSLTQLLHNPMNMLKKKKTQNTELYSLKLKNKIFFISLYFLPPSKFVGILVPQSKIKPRPL